MSNLSLRLPESLHKELKELSKRENVSINQLISIAVAEKVAALKTLDYLKQRASRGRREKFEAALDKVRDIPPHELDHLK
jgi:predicted DNA-binding ribbon-helix-helix protein